MTSPSSEAEFKTKRHYHPDDTNNECLRGRGGWKVLNDPPDINSKEEDKREGGDLVC